MNHSRYISKINNRTESLIRIPKYLHLQIGMHSKYVITYFTNIFRVHISIRMTNANKYVWSYVTNVEFPSEQNPFLGKLQMVEMLPF